MAIYNTKYRVLFPTQNGETMRMDIKEDAYAGPVILLLGGGFRHQYIPASDDPFEPIYASQLQVTILFDDPQYPLTDIPNFNSTDDRKYFVIMYRDYPAYAEFYGWILSDNVGLGFSTGIRELTFNCVDGLGMLDYILFPEAITTNTNSLESLLYFVRTSLTALGYPADLSIFSCISYYSSGMTDRGTDSAAEPLLQAQITFATFKDADYKYISCLQILRNICKSFGARIQQAKGAWYINAINQMCEAFYFTEYAGTGAVIDSGTAWFDTTVTGASNVAPYFINGTQQKIMLKGFNNIYATANIQPTPNSIFNWNLKSHIGNNATGWNEITGGGTSSITIVDNADEEYATYSLDRGTGTSVSVANVSMPTIPTNASLRFSMTFLAQALSGVRGTITLKVVNGASTYYLGPDLLWDTAPTFYIIPAFNGGNYINDISFTTPPCPIGGQLSFIYKLDGTTVATASVGNFKLQVIGLYRKLEVTAKINDDLQYTKKVELPYGFYPGDTLDIASVGVFSFNDLACNGWYRYGKPAEALLGLTELVMQQYVNIFKGNLINVSAEMFLETGFSGASTIIFDDTDPADINIGGNFYLVGAVTRNYASNEIQGVYLKISNTEITADIVSKFYFTGSEAAISFNP